MPLRKEVESKYGLSPRLPLSDRRNGNTRGVSPSRNSANADCTVAKIFSRYVPLETSSNGMPARCACRKLKLNAGETEIRHAAGRKGVDFEERSKVSRRFSRTAHWFPRSNRFVPRLPTSHEPVVWRWFASESLSAEMLRNREVPWRGKSAFNGF